MTCNDAEPLIARYADDDSALAADVRGELASHVAACAGCHAALDDQRAVAALLRGRLANDPRPGLVARVSARIDGEAKGPVTEDWIGLANWRHWTAALVPVAAALLFAAYIDLGRATPTPSSGTLAPTFEEWTAADAPAAVEPSVTGELLIEAVLTGVVPSSGETDGR